MPPLPNVNATGSSNGYHNGSINGGMIPPPPNNHVSSSSSMTSSSPSQQPTILSSLQPLTSTSTSTSSSSWWSLICSSGRIRRLYVGLAVLIVLAVQVHVVLVVTDTYDKPQDEQVKIVVTQKKKEDYSSLGLRSSLEMEAEVVESSSSSVKIGEEEVVEVVEAAGGGGGGVREPRKEDDEEVLLTSNVDDNAGGSGGERGGEAEGGMEEVVDARTTTTGDNNNGVVVVDQQIEEEEEEEVDAADGGGDVVVLPPKEVVEEEEEEEGGKKKKMEEEEEAVVIPPVAAAAVSNKNDDEKVASYHEGQVIIGGKTILYRYPPRLQEFSWNAPPQQQQPPPQSDNGGDDGGGVGVVRRRQLVEEGGDKSPPPSSTKQPIVMIGVTSSIQNIERRNTIRQTWGGAASSSPGQVLYFLVAGDWNYHSIDQEFELYGDMIWCHMKEDVRLNYLKVQTFYHVLHQHTANSGGSGIIGEHNQYVMKTEDDVYVNIPRLLQALIQPQSTKKTEEQLKKEMITALGGDGDDPPPADDEQKKLVVVDVWGKCIQSKPVPTSQDEITYPDGVGYVISRKLMDCAITKINDDVLPAGVMAKGRDGEFIEHDDFEKVPKDDVAIGLLAKKCLPPPPPPPPSNASSTGPIYAVSSSVERAITEESSSSSSHYCTDDTRIYPMINGIYKKDEEKDLAIIQRHSRDTVKQIQEHHVCTCIRKDEYGYDPRSCGASNVLLQNTTTTTTVMKPQSPPDYVNKLEFIHLTKTGGSAIEQAAAKGGIYWGSCHYLFSLQLGCYCPRWNPGEFGLRIPDSDAQIPGGRLVGVGTYNDWHVPPKYYKRGPLAPAKDYGWDNNDDTITKVDLFTVVRNPYDRILSEFYCKWNGPHRDKTDIMTNATKMNDWTIDKIRKSVIRSSHKSQAVLLGHFHYYPQHHYVYDYGLDYHPTNITVEEIRKASPTGGGGRPRAKKVIKHVLKYENLQEEFTNLMKQYQLHDRIQLPQHKTNAGFVTRGGRKGGMGKNTKFTWEDFSQETMDLINRVYRLDFELFGYEMKKQKTTTTPSDGDGAGGGDDGTKKEEEKAAPSPVNNADSTGGDGDGEVDDDRPPQTLSEIEEIGYGEGAAIISGRRLRYRYPPTLLKGEGPTMTVDNSIDAATTVLAKVRDGTNIIVGVLSSSTYVARRESIRQTWAKNWNNVYFIVAGNYSAIEEEFIKHQDMVWLDDIEAYRGLTYKSQIFYHIVHTHVAPELYTHVFKTDDDAYVNIPRVGYELSKAQSKVTGQVGSAELWGFCMIGTKPLRNPKTHPNYVSEEEWPGEYYPDYASGSGHALSQKSLACISTHMGNVTYQHNEDVATGILLAECYTAQRRYCTHETRINGWRHNKGFYLDEKGDDYVMQHYVRRGFEMKERHQCQCGKGSPVMDPISCVNVTQRPLVNKLEFIHITQTGGSAIVQKASRDAGIYWGQCHYRSYDKLDCHCPRWQRGEKGRGGDIVIPPSDIESNSTDVAAVVATANNNNNHAKVVVRNGEWHVPPKYFTRNPFTLVDEHDNHNVADGRVEEGIKGSPSTTADLFTIVRNPYDRAIAEYYCPDYGPYIPKNSPRNKTSKVKSWTEEEIGDAQMMNMWITDRIRGFMNGMYQSIRMDLHFYPQHHYVYDYGVGSNNNNDGDDRGEEGGGDAASSAGGEVKTNSTFHLRGDHQSGDGITEEGGKNAGKQVIKHVLKYETLAEDFNALMKEYGYYPDLELKKGGSITSSEWGPGRLKRLTRQDLSYDTIALLNTFYRRDFEMFGYDMMEEEEGEKKSWLPQTEKKKEEEEEGGEKKSLLTQNTDITNKIWD